jgi:hypothetical protein
MMDASCSSSQNKTNSRVMRLFSNYDYPFQSRVPCGIAAAAMVIADATLSVAIAIRTLISIRFIGSQHQL